MNTLTSVVLLSLLVVFSQGKIDSEDVIGYWGKNITLVGPPEKPIEWHGPRVQLCDGPKILHPEFNHTCNEQNLTLIFLNNSFNGKYYGIRKDGFGMKQYNLKVIAPKASTRRPLSPPQQIDVRMGQNVTLVGPVDTPVNWHGPKHELCRGSQVIHPEVNHTCNEQNLTLLFVNYTFWGAYFGFNRYGTDRVHYEVTIIDGFENAGQQKNDETSQHKPNNKDKPNPKVKNPQRTKNTHKTNMQNKKDIDKDFPRGSNQTLVGPPGSKVDWYEGKNGDLVKLCDGKSGLKVSCNDQNITLIDVNETYAGTYYGSNNDDHRQYRVTVYTIPRNKTVKIQPHTTKGTTGGTTVNEQFALQQGNDKTNQDDEQIPSTTVAIVVGVIAGFITIIIVILCYICCRKRPRTYNQMVDPLLSFSY